MDPAVHKWSYGTSSFCAEMAFRSSTSCARLPAMLTSILFSVLWNAADNDSGVSSNACMDSRHCNGAALVGGPDDHDTDMLSKMSHSDFDAQMSKLGSVRGRLDNSKA